MLTANGLRQEEVTEKNFCQNMPNIAQK